MLQGFLGRPVSRKIELLIKQFIKNIKDIQSNNYNQRIVIQRNVVQRNVVQRNAKDPQVAHEDAHVQGADK